MYSIRCSGHTSIILELSRLIYQKYLVSNFMKICQVGADLFHEDGQT
jgi:hypothetical protein